MVAPNRTSTGPQLAARFDIATSVQLGDALDSIRQSIRDSNRDTDAMIRAALRALAPETLTIPCQLPANAKQQPFTIGNGEVSILRKLTLVRIAPGAFPSSVLWRHDDISGQYILDGNQTTVDIGQTQNGERRLFLTNNDAAVDCCVLVTIDRMPV